MTKRKGSSTIVILAGIALSLGCSGTEKIEINASDFDTEFLTVEEAQNNPGAGEPEYAYLSGGQRLALDAPAISGLADDLLIQSAEDIDDSFPSEFEVYESSDPQDYWAFEWWDFPFNSGAFFVFFINSEVAYLVRMVDYESEITPIALRGEFGNNSIENVQILVEGDQDGVAYDVTIQSVVQGIVRDSSDPVSIEVRN